MLNPYKLRTYLGLTPYLFLLITSCFYHGCPRCFPDEDKINHRVKKSFKQLKEATDIKRNHCLAMGYEYVEMWECNYKSYQRVTVV